MYYTVYKTINKINKKYYIGKHETHDLNDGYLGTGNLIRAAIKKYGKENFIKEILCICETAMEMRRREAELVDHNDQLSYNLIPGGGGAGIGGTISEWNREINRKRMITNNPMKILRTNSGSFKKGAPSPNTKEQNEKIRLGKLGNKNPNYGKIGCWDHINKNLKECIICGLKTTPGNISRWHNENCRKK